MSGRTLPAGTEITRSHAIPGVLSWVVVIATVVGTLAFPQLWAVFGALFLAYFIGRMAVHFTFYLVGEVRCRAWARRNWAATEDEPGIGGVKPSDVWHVVLVPNYTESPQVLHRTLSALAVQHRAAERLFVVLGMEQREAAAAEKAEKLIAEFDGRFARMMATYHPADIEGEIPCKAANQRFAAIAARAELERMGIDPAVVTVTSCDADSVIHPAYYAAVSELFARDERRYSRFWEAPLFYYNNIWDVPAPIRFSSWFTHVGMLGELAMPWFEPLPISTYTLSLKMAEECDWWDPAVISEDWHIYLDCMVQRDGDVCMTPVFLPVHSDAADGDGFFSAMKNRYDQVLRHAWGAEDVGFLFEAMRARGVKQSHLFRFGHVLHEHVFRVWTWFVLTTLPLVNRAATSYAAADDLGVVVMSSLDKIVPTLYTLGMVFLFGAIALDLVRFPPKSRWHFPGVVVELLVMWFMLPVTTFFLSMLPALVAQTKLMLGIPLAWKVTPKSSTPAGTVATLPLPAEAAEKPASAAS